ncbi:MAG: hypothetical protein HY815_07530, partial [Candidatus Riflebacteria bacterium]|nr:hypothetical protein [Candidatus Riflebacteria bacterium]
DPQRPVPGFFLVKMRWDAKDWSKLRSLPGVSGYLGENNLPVPIADKELAMVIRRMAVAGRGKTIVRSAGDGSDQ